MRHAVPLLLVVALGCATGPEVKQTESAADAKLRDDREIAATLRSITAGSRRGEGSKIRFDYMEKARLTPNDWRPRLFAAWVGQPSEESWRQVAAVCKLNPEQPWPWAASGLIYAQWKGGFLDNADAELSKALSLRPDFIPALVGKADVLRLRGRNAEAQDAYRAVLAQAPDWQEALAGLGLSQLALGDDEGANTSLSKALQLDPDDLVALDALAKLSARLKDTARAIELNSRLVQLTPRDREAHLALAGMKAESADAAGAAASYEAAMAIAPDLETARKLAGIDRSLNRADAELKVQEKIAALDAKDPAPHLRLAELHQAAGDTEAAEADLRRASERAPDDAAILLSIARLVEAKGDLIATIEAFRAAKAKGAADAEPELQALEAKAGLGKPIAGDASRVYWEVGARLARRLRELQKSNPGLGGKMRARVTIGADGLAREVEMLEDTVHESSLAALVYFSLKDAKYAKRSTPTFEFVLAPSSSKSK